VIIALIAEGKPLMEAATAALPITARSEGSEEVVEALTNALRLSREPGWRERLSDLGEGWVAEEALAISVLCALAASSTEEAMIAAANHSGDSDSTAAITGNIMGALHGVPNLPNAWVEAVELRDVIETLAEDFAAVLERQADAEALWERYPGH
jgi:ADP-ribosylglycohydrolase